MNLWLTDAFIIIWYNDVNYLFYACFCVILIKNCVKSCFLSHDDNYYYDGRLTHPNCCIYFCYVMIFNTSLYTSF